MTLVALPPYIGRGVSELDPRSGLFPALLKHWRGRRGLSQLDLALAADVSSRHISFLETARSTPSPKMVLRLAAALDVPLRHVNALLTAAGHEPHYAEPADRELSPEVTEALRLMKEHHDPFPLLVINRAYDVLDLNAGAAALLAAVLGEAVIEAGPVNLLRTTFAPEGSHRFIANFHEVGRALLWRVQREALAEPESPLRAVLEEVLTMPTVDDDWREPDLTTPAHAALGLHLRAGDVDLRFVTMITAFQAPQSVELDELRIETWFPSDSATASYCANLIGAL